MKCSEIMKRDIQCVDPEDSALSAAEKMRSSGVGFLPVCEAGNRPIGAITDRDLAIRVIAEQRPMTTRVYDVMTKDVVACSPDDDLHRAEALMVEQKKSRLMCLAKDGTLVGVISLSDIAAHESAKRAGKTLAGVAEREAHP